jgi:hypothetical protein
VLQHRQLLIEWDKERAGQVAVAVAVGVGVVLLGCLLEKQL